MKTAKELISNAAFQCIILQDLQQEILECGTTEAYQNGANQRGVKRSAAFDCYSTTYKNYLATIKQLVDIAPEGTETDELQGFIDS